MTLRRLATALAVCPRRKICSWATLCVVLTIYVASQNLAAQAGDATINGQVTDPGGRVVPGAAVQAVNIGTNVVYPGKTNNVGIYTIQSLPPGPYRVHVHRDGFKEINLTDLTLHTQDTLEQNFQLEVGSTSESVTVNASATNDSPAVSMTVTQAEIENIPLNGRSFQDLIALAPGTVSSAQGNGTFSVNGQRDDANNFTVDGVSANLSSTVAGVTGDVPATSQQASGVYPGQTALGTTQALISVDAMQEFRIQTSGYTAEFGRQPGGQVEITSRSGSNQVHGTAYDYFRNTVFDANNWFLDHNGVPQQAEHQNDFGGTFGGPIWIPRLYTGKDKTFFFFSYEGLRLLLPNSITNANVPSMALRQSAAPGVQPFLNADPIPNGPANADGITALYTGGASPPSRIDATGVRIDHKLSEKYHLFARIADTPSSSISLSYAPYSNAFESEINSLAVTAGATATFTPNLVDELRFNYSRTFGAGQSVPFPLGGAIPLPLDQVVPTQYASLPGGYFSYTSISVPNSALYQDYQYFKYPETQHQINLIDSISWTHGSNTFKSGVDYRRLTPLIGYGQYLTFLQLSSLADIQQGQSDYLYVETGVAAHPIFDNLSLYAQDLWKVSSTLTIDYGLRWELNPPPGASDGLYPLALTSSDLNTTAIAPVGTPLYHTTYTNLAPRLGFAWRATHSITMRAGSGVFYDTGQNLGTSSYNGNPPFNTFTLVNNGNPVSLPVSAANFVPPTLNASLPTPYMFFNLYDPNIKLPYTAQWNVSVDDALGAKNTMSVSYVGNLGKRLLFQQSGIDANPDFGSGNMVATNGAVSNYNALQVQDFGYVMTRLQVIASYTWSHAIDNASTDNGFGVSLPVKGNSDNDLRQSVNGSVNYELPEIRDNSFLKALAGGWSVGDKFAASSGYPVFVSQGTYNINQNQSYIIIPDLVRSVPLYLHNVPSVPGNWQVNPAAFSPIPLNPDGSPTKVGNLPRNYVRGPNFWTLNSSAQKKIKLSDQVGIVFRAEAFNVLNHPSFGNVDNSLPDSTFGEARGSQTVGVANSLYASGAPRSLQFMLKLQF